MQQDIKQQIAELLDSVLAKTQSPRVVGIFPTGISEAPLVGSESGFDACVPGGRCMNRVQRTGGPYSPVKITNYPCIEGAEIAVYQDWLAYVTDGYNITVTNGQVTATINMMVKIKSLAIISGSNTGCEIIAVTVKNKHMQLKACQVERNFVFKSSREVCAKLVAVTKSISVSYEHKCAVRFCTADTMQWGTIIADEQRPKMYDVVWNPVEPCEPVVTSIWVIGPGAIAYIGDDFVEVRSKNRNFKVQLDKTYVWCGAAASGGVLLVKGKSHNPSAPNVIAVIQ
jgi:hypothetical protein